MFYLRDTLHRKAYQHTVACIIELMITEALVLANDHLLYPGKNGKLYRMSEAVNDMEAYSKLTDYVYYQILHSTDPKLAASKNLLERIENRQLFKYIGRINFSSTETTAHLMENVKQEIVEILNDKSIIVKENVLIDPKGLESVNLPRDNSPDDIVLLIVEFDYGMEEKDPMENVRFYSKDNMFEAQKLRKQQVSTMLTDNFAERYLRIYSKSSNPERVKLSKLGVLNKNCLIYHVRKMIIYLHLSNYNAVNQPKLQTVLHWKILMVYK